MADPTQQRTALVVDDDAVTRRFVVHGLEPLGFTRIFEAEDGGPAQRILDEHEIDVVVTDLLMPGVDGPGLIRWAKDASPGPEWIILSGVETFDAALDAIHLGAFDFLTKPPDVRELRVAVRNALSRRELVREKERLLERLRESSMDLLDKVRELEEKTERIRSDLVRAEVIQRSLLPSRPPPVDGLRFESLYQPGTHVGGDLYDVAAAPTGEVVFYVADATGHGVSAAMLSVLFKQRLAPVDGGGRAVPPALVLQRINRCITRDVRAPGLFLTAAYAAFDPSSRALRIASAGHTPVALLRAQGEEVEFLERTGPALGLELDARYGEHRVRLGAGDRLLLYTDGILDADAGRDSIRAAVSSAFRRIAAGESLATALGELSAGSQRRDRDDVTLLFVEAANGASRFDNGEDHERRKPGAADASPAARSAVVWTGTAGDATLLVLRGRATWPYSDTFYRAARTALDEGRRAALDLAGCEHLDSTFLGTIHEIVAGARDRVTVHAPSAAVRELFEELGLDTVIERVTDTPAPAAVDLEPLRAGGTTSRDSQLRLLRAHETLAELSAENREKFASIVEALRADLGREA